MQNYSLKSKIASFSVHHNKGCRLPPEPLSDAEIARVYQYLDKSWSIYAYRGMAYVTLCLRGLLRNKEAISLYPKDIDVDAGLVRVLNGKGRKTRVVGMDRKACQIVREWLQFREERGIGLDAPIICTVRKGAMGQTVPENWPRIFMRNLGKKCGIHKRVHPHGLRHTGAFQLLNEGAPLNIIQKQLGHSNLATTYRYVNHLNPTAVLKFMCDREWT